MKIICDKNTLNDAIQTVSRAVAVKSNLASIEGILFVAENGTLTLTGYDFEMGIKTTFECDVEMEGDIVLSSGLLGNIVAYRYGNSLHCILCCIVGSSQLIGMACNMAAIA